MVVTALVRWISLSRIACLCLSNHEMCFMDLTDQLYRNKLCNWFWLKTSPHPPSLPKRGAFCYYFCFIALPHIVFSCSNENFFSLSSLTGLDDVVAIMIPEPKGKEIVSLLERNITVMMYITIGTRNLQKYVSRTSVVFVSISFIVLMIISLAWLVFYYIQRFRYANARDRNQVS